MRVNVGIIDPFTGERPRGAKDRGFKFSIQELADYHKLELKCVKCGTEKYLTRDHIIPYSTGGHNEKWNMLPLCNHCNSAVKGGMENPEEFYFDCSDQVKAIVAFSLFAHETMMDFPDIYLMENKSNGKHNNPCVVNNGQVNKLQKLWWHNHYNNQ